MAAYVGKVRITEADVDAVIKDLGELVTDDNRVEIRHDVVTMLVLRAAGTEYARAEGITVPDADTEAMAIASQVPADRKFTVLLAELDAVLRALDDRVQPASPTEADQREAYANLETNGVQVPPFEELRQFFSTEAMGPAVGRRNLLGQVVQRADVAVNPKYGHLAYPIRMLIAGQVPSRLDVAITDQASNPVADSRTADTQKADSRTADTR